MFPKLIDMRVNNWRWSPYPRSHKKMKSQGLPKSSKELRTSSVLKWKFAAETGWVCHATLHLDEVIVLKEMWVSSPLVLSKIFSFEKEKLKEIWKSHIENMNVAVSNRGKSFFWNQLKAQRTSFESVLTDYREKLSTDILKLPVIPSFTSIKTILRCFENVLRLRRI